MMYPKFYKHYAMQHNVTEDEQYESDIMDTPNNPLAGYIVWMYRMLSQYKKSHPSSFIGDTPINLKKLDIWLSSITHFPDSLYRKLEPHEKVTHNDFEILNGGIVSHAYTQVGMLAINTGNEYYRLK